MRRNRDTHDYGNAKAQDQPAVDFHHLSPRNIECVERKLRLSGMESKTK
jgi:hypothetical protein